MKWMLPMKAVVAFASVCLVWLVCNVAAAVAADPAFVAGTTPDRRPEGAPVASTKGLSEKQREVALKGVSQPYPPSLKWLDDQGHWYTPFSHPGMPGPYDIRNLHKRSQ